MGITKIFKNRLFLPVTAAAVLTGYGLSEWVVPKYIVPAVEEAGYEMPTQRQFSWEGNDEYLQRIFSRYSPSGNYLAGQFARRQKDWANANDYMDQILRKDPENIDLKKNMMVLTMEAGYSNRAVSLAKDILKIEPDNMLATLFLTVDNLETENYIEATKTLDQIDQSNPASFIVPVLKLWISAAKGQLTFEGMEENSFYMYHLLLAAKYLNTQPEAVAYIEEHIQKIDVDLRDVEKLADLLSVTGGRDLALTLYQSFLENIYSTATVEKKIKALQEEKDIQDLVKVPTISNPKQGAAQVFLDMATIMYREGSDDSATIFAQMALYLDDNLSNARLIVANVLSSYEQYDDAARYLNTVEKNDPLYSYAQKTLAELYLDQDKTTEAIETLKVLYKQNDDIDALVQIGNVHRFEEDYDQSIKVYSKVIDEIESHDEKTEEEYWHVLYARGMAYERLKKYDRSEEDLQAALQYRPDHPYLLNYLGYSWVDQGRNLDQSLKMLKQAASLKPDDGYIIDSLGWAYYKMGDIDRAIAYLENAVELLPYDATINDHLGDAYWKNDRRLEAQFQWRRAFNYSEDNEEELRVSIQDKLENGLPHTEESKNKTETAQSVDAVQTLN